MNINETRTFEHRGTAVWPRVSGPSLLEDASQRKGRLDQVQPAGIPTSLITCYIYVHVVVTIIYHRTVIVFPYMNVMHDFCPRSFSIMSVCLFSYATPQQLRSLRLYPLCK